MIFALKDLNKQDSYVLIKQILKFEKSPHFDFRDTVGYIERTLMRSHLSVRIIRLLVKTLSGLPDYLDCFDRGAVPGGQFLSQYFSFCLGESSDFADRLVDYCELCGISLTIEEYADELLVLFILSLNSKLIPEFKYWANLVFVRHFDDLESPLCSGVLGTDLVPRRLRVFLNRIKSPKKRLSDKNLTLIYTAFQGLKKGFMPGRPDMIDASLKKHKKALCDKEPTASPEVLDVCERVASELFRNYKTPRKFSNFHLPSRNSTIQSNYMNGGQLGALRDLHWEDSCFLPRVDHLVSIVERRNQLVEVRTSYFTFDELVSTRTKFQRGEFFSEPSAQPYCIVEPMKIRIITKPSVFQHFGVKAVQKKMWRTLFDHESGIFNLIGSTIDETQIASVLRAWKPGKKFCSGDYSGATDNLLGDVTERIAKTIFGDAEPDLYHWLWRTLKPSKLIYSKCHPKYGNILDAYKYSYENLGTQQQKNGQLMGSILSFVILCVANLAAYVHSLESFYGIVGITIRDLMENPDWAVKVNGDDILFACDEQFYAHWRKVITLFGFEPSIGKNLFSDEILQINSALFRPKYMDTDKDILGRILPSKKCVGASWVSYVNYGLITTRKKQDCSKDTRVISKIFDTDQIAQSDMDGLNRLKVLKKVQTILLEGLPHSVAEIANRQFWSFSSYLSRTFERIDFFADESWGGVGLDSRGIDIPRSDKFIYDQNVNIKDKFFKPTNLNKGDLVLREYYATMYPEAMLMDSEFDVFDSYKRYIKGHRGLYCPRPQALAAGEFTGVELKTSQHAILDLTC